MGISVINLEGRWRGEGDENSGRAVISVSSSSITINMSTFGRPAAHGSIINDSTFNVNFPDDRTYTGTLEGPKIIR